LEKAPSHCHVVRNISHDEIEDKNYQYNQTMNRDLQGEGHVLLQENIGILHDKFWKVEIFDDNYKTK